MPKVEQGVLKYACMQMIGYLLKRYVCGPSYVKGVKDLREQWWDNKIINGSVDFKYLCIYLMQGAA